MWNTDKHKPQGKHRTCTCMAKDNYSTKRTYYYESTRELCNGRINKASIGSCMHSAVTGISHTFNVSIYSAALQVKATSQTLKPHLSIHYSLQTSG